MEKRSLGVVKGARRNLRISPEVLKTKAIAMTARKKKGLGKQVIWCLKRNTRRRSHMGTKVISKCPRKKFEVETQIPIG